MTKGFSDNLRIVSVFPFGYSDIYFKDSNKVVSDAGNGVYRAGETKVELFRIIKKDENDHAQKGEKKK